MEMLPALPLYCSENLQVTKTKAFRRLTEVVTVRCEFHW
jgi:hypothetical protein